MFWFYQDSILRAFALHLMMNFFFSSSWNQWQLDTLVQFLKNVVCRIGFVPKSLMPEKAMLRLFVFYSLKVGVLIFLSRLFFFLTHFIILKNLRVSKKQPELSLELWNSSFGSAHVLESVVHPSAGAWAVDGDEKWLVASGAQQRKQYCLPIPYLAKGPPQDW